MSLLFLNNLMRDVASFNNVLHFPVLKDLPKTEVNIATGGDVGIFTRESNSKGLARESGYGEGR